MNADILGGPRIFGMAENGEARDAAIFNRPTEVTPADATRVRGLASRCALRGQHGHGVPAVPLVPAAKSEEAVEMLRQHHRVRRGAGLGDCEIEGANGITRIP